MSIEKPGFKTSEFWTSLAATAAAGAPAILAAFSGNATTAAVLGAISLVAPVVYVWGRCILKAEQAKQTDVLSDAWEQRLGSALDIIERLAQALSPKEEK